MCTTNPYICPTNPYIYPTNPNICPTNQLYIFTEFYFNMLLHCIYMTYFCFVQ